MQAALRSISMRFVLTGVLTAFGVLVVAILAVVGLTMLLTRTSLGHQMQAAAQNPTVARIIGVPVERGQP